MQNYVRYASFYVKVLQYIGKMDPVLKELLASTVSNVQGQDIYLLKTTINMGGEQTLNSDA